MLGLCDEHIAHGAAPEPGDRAIGHEKGDGAYVLEREPHLVLFGAARGRPRPVFVSDRQLHDLPKFHRRYVLEGYELPSGELVWMWRRRDFGWPRAEPVTSGGR